MADGDLPGDALGLADAELPADPRRPRLQQTIADLELLSQSPHQARVNHGASKPIVATSALSCRGITGTENRRVSAPLARALGMR
jgi:hypothetical protein